MENTISDRIFLLISKLGYNKRTFSQEIGLSNDVTIGRIVNEQREPSYKILSSIIQTFGNVNANWLMTGKGDMFLDKKYTPEYTPEYTPGYNEDIEKNTYPNTHQDTYLTEKSVSSDEKKALLNTCSGVFERKQRECVEAIKKLDDKFPPIKQQDDDKNILQIDPLKISRYAVPFYDIPVSAGPLGVLTYSKDTIKPDGYIDMEIFRRCEAILPVIGVSMEPEIHSGDLIGIRKLERYSWEYVETGRVYMIVTQEDRVIKYINKADDPEYIICSSPNYHDFRIRKADVLEVYRVIANIRAL